MLTKPCTVKQGVVLDADVGTISRTRNLFWFYCVWTYPRSLGSLGYYRYRDRRHPGKGLMYVHSHIKAHRNTFSTVITCCLEIDHQLFLTVGWSLF